MSAKHLAGGCLKASILSWRKTCCAGSDSPREARQLLLHASGLASWDQNVSPAGMDVVCECLPGIRHAERALTQFCWSKRELWEWECVHTHVGAACQQLSSDAGSAQRLSWCPQLLALGHKSYLVPEPPPLVLSSAETCRCSQVAPGDPL